jgi:hypothetical protein
VNVDAKDKVVSIAKCQKEEIPDEDNGEETDNTLGLE